MGSATPAPATAPPPSASAVREQLARWSGTDPADWFLVDRDRHAALAVLRAVCGHAGPGEVVVQPFAPLTTVTPVLGAGHRPRYADIDRDTLSLDPATVPMVSSSSTRAVVVRHTFGPVAPVARLRAFLPPGALLVEDSAHCPGHLARTADGRVAADVSLHGFEAGGALPLASGAAVWISPALREGPWHDVLAGALADLPQAGRRDAVARRAGGPLRRVAGRLGPPGARVLSAAAERGLVELDVTDAERSGRSVGEPHLPSEDVLRRMRRTLPVLGTTGEHRRAVAAVYRLGLSGEPGVAVPRLLEDPATTLVRFPLLVPSTEVAEAVLAALRGEGLDAGAWYRPTLWPGPRRRSDLHYDPSGSPVAEEVSARVLTLPTSPLVSIEAAHRTVEVLRPVVREGRHQGQVR
ncbi:DegT/DnrJ/EryC1/StrS family aminotransferase [Ornithinimicrobium sp. W1679]|uniref:DegT/DnrJ/EryC1/StrS family aminotransferase n=1 Tax=Ornithinimicrobium sp. W1679 TaxID=3418770 RepID=UPI003CE712A6